MNNENDSFNWETGYKGGNRLTPNKSVKGQNSNQVCYSFEPYAQELFNLYTSSDHKIVRKDLSVGDTVKIVDVYPGKVGILVVELEGGLVVDLNVTREKKFSQLFGFSDPVKFAEIFGDKSNKEKFLASEPIAYVVEVDPIRISLWQGYIIKTKEEFIQEISAPTQAYKAKVLEANKGGYFVEVNGVDAFMPGSLAAPNKIADFKTLLGKEVIVMIEDYIKEMNSFIVSHKKYIEYIMPSRIQNMDLEKKYTGIITGTSKYGIFLEFEEIFTGLLHVSKMSETTLTDFRARKFQVGEELGFYINEITKDNRLILTEESPVERKAKIDNFVEKYGERSIEAKVAAVMGFGVIVNFGDISGLVPNKEFRKKRIFTNNLTARDTISVIFSELNDNKIIFRLPGKEEKKEVKEPTS